MSSSFSINSSASFAAADDDSATKFNPKIKPIAPLPDTWPPNKKLENLPNPVRDGSELISEMGLRKLREDLEEAADDMGMDEYIDMPVEGFGAAFLSAYGWKEGWGIGRNANVKEDEKVWEIGKNTGRRGLGFTGETPDALG